MENLKRQSCLQYEEGKEERGKTENVIEFVIRSFLWYLEFCKQMLGYIF